MKINLKSQGIVKCFFFAMIAVFALSCSKDDSNSTDQSQTNFEHNYFTVMEADFSNSALPSSTTTTGLDILDLAGNQTVLPGGSNPITIFPSNDAKQLLVGVKGQEGYFKLPIPSATTNRMADAGQSVMISLLIGQQASSDFAIQFVASDGNGNYGAAEYLSVSLMAAGTGLLQVSLSWDQPNDVDLHLIEPDGTEIYYGNSYSDATGAYLDVDSNAACSIDNINNENIFYSDTTGVTVPQGEYQVLVDLWSNCNVNPDTHYIVSVYYGGALISTSEANPFNGTLTPADDDSEPTQVMTFSIDGAVPRPAPNGPKVYKFKFDNANTIKRPKVLSPEKLSN